MYILKNAWISITRNKSRNILIAIIITVISAACAITLAIRNSANKIVEAYENKYEVEASIGMNRQNLMESLKGEGDEKNSQEEMIEAFNDIKSLTVAEIKKYGDSDYVKNYYYYYETNMNAKDLDEATDSLVKETTKTETTTETHQMPNGGDGFGRSGSQTTTNKKTTTTEKIFNEKAANGAFQVKGYSSLESMTDFIDGNYTITSGSIFTDFASTEKNYNCIISEELASLNELEVNDTITLINPTDEDKTYTLTITGIYKENSDTSSDMTNMFTRSANTIIVPAAFVEQLMSDDEDLNVTTTPTYILTSKDVATKFADEVTEKGLSEYYSVTNNLEVVESATKSITNVKKFATTFLIITLIIGGVVLLVINMINIRERKYEIGVLRTIGMKKILVVIQFMTELLVVTIFGLLVGAGIGATCSVKVANNLLQTEINNATSDQENIKQNFGNPNDDNQKNHHFDFSAMNGTINIETVDDINAVVDFKVLAQLLAIGIVLTIISSVSASIAIARFQPLNILKERS